MVGSAALVALQYRCLVYSYRYRGGGGGRGKPKMSHSSKICMSPGIPNNLLYEKLSMDLVYMGLFLSRHFCSLCLNCVNYYGVSVYKHTMLCAGSCFCMTTIWERFSSYLDYDGVRVFSPMPYVVIYFSFYFQSKAKISLNTSENLQTLVTKTALCVCV